MKLQEPTYTMKGYLAFLFASLIILIVQPVTFAQEGKLVNDTLHSLALEDNLLGDSADRRVVVYLPPSYETASEQHYPVVYLLHGYTGFPSRWTGGYQGFNIKTVMDTLVGEGKVREMIFVMPDGHNKYGGSMYTNSATTGNWEDFVTQELG